MESSQAAAKRARETSGSATNNAQVKRKKNETRKQKQGRRIQHFHSRKDFENLGLGDEDEDEDSEGMYKSSLILRTVVSFHLCSVILLVLICPKLSYLFPSVASNDLNAN